MLEEQITGADTAALAKQLREGRAKRDWSLREAAAKTGISNGYLSLMEHGEVRAPSPRYLRVLADQYELVYEDLMMLAGHSGSSAVSGDATVVRRRESATSGHLRGRTRSRGPAVFGMTGALPGTDMGTSPSEAVPAPEADTHKLRLQLRDLRSPARERSVAAQAERSDAAERSELTELLMDDLASLSMQDIAQVRGFIAGLRSVRR